MRRRAVVCAAALAFALLPAATAGADLDDDLAAVNERIEDLEDRLANAAGERSGIVDEILTTRDRLAAAESELASAESELRSVRLSLAQTEFDLAQIQEQLVDGYAAIADTRRRIRDNRGDAQEWVRNQYMRRSEADVTSVVLTTEKVTDLGRVLYLMTAVTDRATASIDRHEALVTQEERQQLRNEERERALQATRDTIAAEEAAQASLTLRAGELEETVRSELAAQTSLLDELDAIIAEFETELDGLEREEQRLRDLIDGSSGSGGSSPGQLVRPVPGKITSPFGPRLHPILGYTRMHTGVDMTAPLGQDIVAGADGVVILASDYGGYGLTVVIDHGGGMTTLYAHQSRVFVSRGDSVAAGEAIGEAGSSGLATGPHLHFEVRLDGTPVDPADYL